MDFQFGGGFWLVSILAIAASLVFWGLVIAALVLGVRWLIRQNSQDRPAPPTSASSSPGPAQDPLDVLRHRYARGEIDEEEYERRRKTLTGG